MPAWAAAGEKLPVDPNSEFFEVHAFVEVVVNHVGDKPGDTFVVVLLHQVQSLSDDVVVDVVAGRVIALAAGQEGGGLQKDQPQGEHIRLIQNFKVLHALLLHPQRNDELGR